MDKLAVKMDAFIAFEVLAEQRRRDILDVLRERERPVRDIVGALDISQPLVSKHLRVLRYAGLVDVRVEGTRRFYRVRVQPLQAMDEWLAPYRALWSERLDEFERHLDRMDADATPTPTRKKATKGRRR